MLRENSKTVTLIAPGHLVGDARIYHLECNALQKAGFMVTLIAHAPETYKITNGITVHSLGERQPSLKLHFRDRFRRSQAAYRIAVKSKAALFHYIGMDFVLWGRALGRATGRPVIFECREDFEAYARHRRGIPDIARPAAARYASMLMGLGACSSDAVIVADQGTGNKLSQRARRLLVLHGFPRLDLFSELDHVTKVKPYDIVLYGSLPKYHLDVCLAVDSVLVRRGYYLHWYLIGQIPEMSWLTYELSRNKSSDRFHFSDYVPHKQLSSEITKAKIGIIPLPNFEKFRNNIPQKLFELMALGMPIVMSDLPPTRQFAPDGTCAFRVPPDQYESYADAIIRLLKNTGMRHKMGMNGRERVRAEYNWDRESIKLVSLYNSLLVNKR